jgi:hypothetical protein
MAFRRGDFRSFVRGSVQAMRVLESVTAPQLAGAVPHMRLRQVDPFTAEVIGDDIMKELLATPRFTDPMGLFFAERPLVSFNSLEVKSDQQYGYNIKYTVQMEFTVHKPDVVFSATDYAHWRELLVEGNSFILEYGWTANPGAVPNDLFNGLGYYDQSIGLIVPSRVSMLLVGQTYSCELEANGSVRFNFTFVTAGNLGLRQLSLADEIVVDAIERASPLENLKTALNLLTDDKAEAVRRVLSARLNDLVERQGFERGGRRFIRLGQVLDTFVSPVLERMCTRIGYSRADLFLGNFNPKAGLTVPEYGSEDMSGRSIGDFPVPVDALRQVFSGLAVRNKIMRVESLVEAILNMTRGPTRWKAGSRVPSVASMSQEFPQLDGRVVYFYAVGDVMDGSDVLDGFDPQVSDSDEGSLVSVPTKAEIFSRLEQRGVPVIELDRIQSLVKTFSFNINPEPPQRSIYAERGLQTRKDAVAVVEQPDPRALAGRSNSAQVVPLGVLQGSVTMVGNFVFGMFGYAWVEFYGAYPISGVYNVRERVDRIEAGNFTTTVGLISTGLDPFNTRRRLTNSQIRESRRVQDAQRSDGRSRAKKR